jgi:hypothetical protein
LEPFLKIYPAHSIAYPLTAVLALVVLASCATEVSVTITPGETSEPKQIDPSATQIPLSNTPTETVTAIPSPVVSAPAVTPQPSTKETLVLSLTAVPIMTNQPSSSPPQDFSTNALVETARQDLSKRLNVPADQIELVSFEPVVWPDGSLGCPQPNMFYIQIQVEGYRIILQHNNLIYDYHGGGRRAPFLCEGKN